MVQQYKFNVTADAGDADAPYGGPADHGATIKIRNLIVCIWEREDGVQIGVARVPSDPEAELDMFAMYHEPYCAPAPSPGIAGEKGDPPKCPHCSARRFRESQVAAEYQLITFSEQLGCYEYGESEFGGVLQTEALHCAECEKEVPVDLLQGWV